MVVVIAALLAVSAGVMAAGAGDPQVVVPNFWDPKHRTERPAAGAVAAIRFVTSDDYPPFDFDDADGHLTGFNVDLARAICAELHIRCTIQARPFADLVGALKSHIADAAIAGIAVSEANRADLDFSDVYLRSPARFVVRRNGPRLDFTAAGLKGHTIAVVAGTAHEAYLAAFFPAATRKAYPDPDAARLALKTGEADALFADGVQSSLWLQSDAAGNCCGFAGGPYLESHFFGEGMAIAVLKGSDDLKRALNTALEAIHDKGVYAELYLRYFPVGFY